MSIRSMMIVVAVMTAVAGATSWTPVQGQDDDILEHVINSPPVESWQVLGVQGRIRPTRAEGVPGERAIRVRVTRAEAQPWAVSAQMPIAGEIRQGDVILLAVWARAHTPPEGEDAARLSSLRIQQNSAPYDAIAEDSAMVGPEWTMVYASGVAERVFAGGQANLSVHLGAAAQTVELGPAFVLNFGPDHDLSRLPRNTRR